MDKIGYKELEKEVETFATNSINAGKNIEFVNGLISGMVYAFQFAGLISGKEMMQMKRDCIIKE